MGFTTLVRRLHRQAAGSLTIDPKAPANADSLDVTVQTASVATTNAKLDGELRDPSWFDAAKFTRPSRFRSTRVTPTGPGKRGRRPATSPCTASPARWCCTPVFNGAGARTP